MEPRAWFFLRRCLYDFPASSIDDHLLGVGLGTFGKSRYSSSAPLKMFISSAVVSGLVDASSVDLEKSVSQARIPLLILVFFTIDSALGVAYVLDYLAGHPYGLVTRLLDLGQEGNLPTWYSSVQWFSVAALLAIFARANFRISHLNSWPLLMLPFIFFAFSLDEVASIHERLALKTDVFLLGGSRKNTPFFRTGIWMFVFGVPFVVLFGMLILSIRSYFRRAPGAFVKIFVGMAISLAGALGIETLSNFVDFDSLSGIIQVTAEELCEMAGSTIVLWGSYELLCVRGFAFRFDNVRIET